MYTPPDLPVFFVIHPRTGEDMGFVMQRKFYHPVDRHDLHNGYAALPDWLMEGLDKVIDFVVLSDSDLRYHETKVNDWVCAGYGWAHPLPLEWRSRK